MKAVLRENKALSASKKQLERAYTCNLIVHLNALEQKEANTWKRSRRQEIVKLRAEINQVDTKRTIQRINKIRSWYFAGKIIKIEKSLAKLSKGQRDSIQIKNIRSETGDITTETEQIKKKIRSHYKSLY